MVGRGRMSSLGANWRPACPLMTNGMGAMDRQDKLPNLYLAHDFFLFQAFMIPGVVVLEALSYGLP